MTNVLHTAKANLNLDMQPKQFILQHSVILIKVNFQGNATLPHVMESLFRNPGNFLLVESGILALILNPEYLSRNPESH